MTPDARPRLSSHRAGRTRPGRAFTAVLPVLAVVAVVGVVVVVLVPSVRHQVVVSTTRQSDPYVELYFAQVQQARACPTEAGGRRAQVDARVDSHLADPARIGWRVTVTSRTGSRTVDGRTTVAAESTGRISTTVRIPAARAAASAAARATGARARDYVVRVSLPGRAAALQVRCTDGGAA